jgi:hypothetical protein
MENVVSADLNNDGGLDLLVADRVSSRLVSYLNRTKKIGSISFDSGRWWSHMICPLDSMWVILTPTTIWTPSHPDMTRPV